MPGPQRKSKFEVFAGGQELQDKRPAIETDDKIDSVKPPSWLPPEVRKEFFTILGRIKKNPKARAAFSVADTEMLIVVATSFATYRSHMLEFFANNQARNSGELGVENKKWLTREMGKLQADLRNGLSTLLLTPNSRSRVVVDNEAGGATDLDDFLKNV